MEISRDCSARVVFRGQEETQAKAWVNPPRLYCTVEDVRRHTGLPTEALMRVGVRRMIERASAEIERMTGFVFVPTPVYEEFRSPAQYSFLRKCYFPSNNLELKNSPIVKVNYLKVGDVEVDPNTLHIVGNLVYLTEDSEIQNFGVREKIAIEYVHGILDDSVRRLVRQLCVVLVALEIADSPYGSNELFKNSVYAELSAGDLRPDSIPQDIVSHLVREVNRLIRLIPKKGEVW